MGIQEWSATDIEKARQCFLGGLQIKEIARELGRSETAINKALTRFGIRVSKRRKNVSDIPLLTTSAFNKVVFPSFDRKTLRQELENWVSFWQLCEYLANQKVHFYELSAPNIPLACRQFRVGTKILNARQLLLMANKIRSENNLKAFFVKELSW